MIARLLITGFASLALIGAAQAGEKRIAFTYDDGPRPDGAFLTGEERTKAFIEALKKGGVEQAAFFITTRNFERDDARGRVAQYAAAGHVIANHSDQHVWAHKTETADYIADIDLAEEKLKGFDNRRQWFRFPFLDEGREEGKRDVLREALAERGLMSGYVTIDTYDWYMDNIVRNAKRDGECVNLEKAGETYVSMLVAAAEHFDAMARETRDRIPAQVLLLHENDLGAMFADDLAAALRNAGWEIITADAAFADPIAQELPETTFSGMGRLSAIAYEAGWRGDRLDHPAVDEAAIDARFAEAGVFACEGE